MEIVVGMLRRINKSGQTQVAILSVDDLATEAGLELKRQVKASFEMSDCSQALRLVKRKAETFHHVVLGCRVIECRERHLLGEGGDPSRLGLFVIHVEIVVRVQCGDGKGGR